MTYQGATPENFLIAMLVVFGAPFLVWRYLKADYFAPLVVVQIVLGIVLGPSVMGACFPELYNFIFNPTILLSLSGIAWWAVILFVFVAGLELDLSEAWQHRKESGITASLALGFPLMCGALAGFLLLQYEGWIGEAATNWQFMLGVGMSCAVTALPILVLMMERLEFLRLPIGQRVIRYASLDDIAIWIVLAIVLMDWSRIGQQLIFVLVFSTATVIFRSRVRRVDQKSRLHFAIVWTISVSFGADWCGLHFMVGAFLAGAVINKEWFDLERIDYLRSDISLIILPVFFLITGLKTEWSIGGIAVFLAAAVLLCASILGKLLGISLAGKILRWGEGEAAIIGWLLQTKALIMIIFANTLLDTRIITGDTFAALLIMAIASTMLTVPMVAPRIARHQLLATKSGGANE